MRMSEPFDFFQAGELPAPVVSVPDAVAIARDHFGLAVTATALGSQQDANFLLRGATGEPVGVLKVANPAFGRVEIEAQDAQVPPLPAGVGNLLMTALGLPPGKHIGALRDQLAALCTAGEIEARQEPGYYVEVVRSRGLAEGLQVVAPRGLATPATAET